MAPRGKPRKPSRMDAAVDAMIPFGFPKALVLKKMDELLEEYGGDVGYPFIEAEAYKVLIDAILASEEEESKQEGETSMKGDSSEGERVGDDTAGPSAENVESPISQPVDAHLQTDLAEGDGDRGKKPCNQDTEATVDAGEYPAGEGHHQDSPAVLSPSSRASSPELQGVPTRTRKPLYGWIDDDDDNDNDGELDGFVYLTPAFTGITLRKGQGSEPKRKSRWDVRPEMPFQYNCCFH